MKNSIDLPPGSFSLLFVLEDDATADEFDDDDVLDDE